jgi:hypothetical protein
MLTDRDYGYFCLNHSRQFGGQTVDKLTFTIPRDHLFKKVKLNIMSPKLEIHLYGNYAKLHIHGEYIDPTRPLIESVANVFYQAAGNRIFRKEINYPLYRCLNGTFGYQGLILQLRELSFRLSELELAFDFFDCEPCSPIEGRSLYSNDHKRYFRHFFDDDGGVCSESKGRRKSILCIYDRGRKLGVPETVYRVEWRIRDERAKYFLEIDDLSCTMEGYILKKGDRIRNITENYFNPDAMPFNRDYIRQNFPLFSLLITV